jgi:hypothetical protein
MTGRGKRGKPKPGFPLFPQPLEIAAAISTFPPPDYDWTYANRQTKTKKERTHPQSPAFASFRLILGLENAPRAKTDGVARAN